MPIITNFPLFSWSRNSIVTELEISSPQSQSPSLDLTLNKFNHFHISTAYFLRNNFNTKPHTNASTFQVVNPSLELSTNPLLRPAKNYATKKIYIQSENMRGDWTQWGMQHEWYVSILNNSSSEHVLILGSTVLLEKLTVTQLVKK